MKCDIYEHVSNKNKRLLVPTGNPVPVSLSNLYKPTLLKTVDCDQNLIGLDSDKCIEDIQHHGYHEAGVKISITEID